MKTPLFSFGASSRERVSRGAGLFLVATSLALAQAGLTEPMPPDASPRGDGMNSELREDEPSRGDERFFRKAARLGEKEVLISRIAAERATDPRVREFAAEMVRAHTQANEELTVLARRKGAKLAALDADERREAHEKWRDAKGSDFDEDYLEAAIECHQDTVDTLENGAESKDVDIMGYAARMLPVVKAHLARAEQLEESIDD